MGEKIEDTGRTIKDKGEKERIKAKGHEIGDKLRDAGEKVREKLAEGAHKFKDTVILRDDWDDEYFLLL